VSKPLDVLRLASLAATLAAPLVLGCDQPSPGEPRRTPASLTSEDSGLFESVAEKLDQLEQFDTEQILKQIADRLNQWYVQDKPQAPWDLDPLLATLDKSLYNDESQRQLELVRYQAPDDGWFLQEAVWLRDVSNVARGDQFEDLAVAQRLFDWTVRNIRLESDDEAPHPHWPYETLLLGRGTALERAWVFTLLARQQGLDVVMLALAEPSGAPRPWLPALVLGDDLYLFDTRLGLPIPGPTEGKPATLAQVAADPDLLRRLDLDAEHPYPVKAEDLKHVVALVEGSPAGLSRRMKLVESKLTGKHKARLTSPGSELAERVKKLSHVADARLWPLGFEVGAAKKALSPQQQQELAREMVIYQAMPPLKRGRALQFKGQYEGDQGAKTQYLNARPPDQYINQYKLSDQMIQKLRIPRESVSRVEAAQTLIMRDAKHNATFWLGLIFFEQNDYPNAIDFFGKRVVEAAGNSPWVDAARYNLARAYEAEGNLPQAIALYESDTTSPQSHGNRLRARWLKEHSPSAANPGSE
jgi:hypothetical protein